ncbi:hypothetical protein CVT25_005930 [Psilocybe cyanescens]|uniref:CHAT domain-containing protein n=1 Tax=Psilocybe cyanescens TaxID=93625 RepID=A0A409VSR3_PSICY|nr:hypothetical protein CVT25_005930 [Psilocybe cyanescens]
MSLREEDEHLESAVTMSFKDLVVGPEVPSVDETPLTNSHMTIEDVQLDTHCTLRSDGDKFLNIYRVSKNKDDIDSSVRAYERAVQLAGADAQLPNYQYDYATALLERYTLVRDLSDIDLAISTMKTALKATPDGNNDITQCTGILSSLYIIRYESTMAMDDLSQAIEALRKTINAIHDDADRMVSNLYNISVLLQRRFRISHHDLVDISDAICFQQRLVDLMPESHPNMPAWMDSLGASLECRFQFTSDLGDISKAISALSKAIELTPDGDPQAVQRFGKRGILFRRRYHYGGAFTDISDAVQDHENALRIVPVDYPDIYELLGNVGNSYLSMYDYTENPEDISEAVIALQNALHLIPDGNPDIPGQWSNLGSALLRRFECTGDPKQISEAISAQQKAVELVLEGDAGLPSILNNLGHSYQIRFDVAGDLLDISEAISAHRKSICLTSESHIDMPGRLSNLGIALQCRADRTGDITDISEAIDAHRRAVELCRAGHAHMPVFLSSLGNAIYARFKAQTDPKDIDEAISLQQQAITLIGEEHVAMAVVLHHNLSLALKNRFSVSSKLDDIDTAVSSAEKALELTRQDRSSDLIMRLTNLGTVLHVRFEHFKCLDDICKAISVQEKAIQLTPDDHPSRSGLIVNMGLYMADRFEHEGNRTDIETAVVKYKEAASLTSGPPSIRLRAAKQWASTAKIIDGSGVASLEAYAMAISLLSQVAGMEKTIGLRHRNLYGISDLSTEAAATAFGVGKYELALEWLEQGRCLVWNQLNNLRTPLDHLSSEDSKLADDLSRVARELEAAGLRDEATSSGIDSDIMIEKATLQDEATANIRLAREWDALLAKVRSIHGLEDFLRPVKFQDLVKRTPDKGYIAVINIHEDRCDAIVLVGGAKNALHIPLHKFSYDDALRLVRLLRSFLTSHKTRTDQDMEGIEGETRGIRPYVNSSNPMTKILGDLWAGVVNPVLQALGISSSPEHLKRLWWCPTGPLSFLPIHAAGIYNGTSNICVSDCVISSYIPTVSSLVESAQLLSAEYSGGSKVLIIGQADAPGLPPLPGAKLEVHVLKEKFSSANVQFSCLEGPLATIDRTMKEMEAHSCIHFACHAIQETSHPLNSGFYLSDGRLELWTMIKIQTKNAEFAFLSACQTSKGNDWLSEEAVHLAAGMLAVGYRGVVATMWSIQDRYGVKVAEDFYSDLFNRRRETSEKKGMVGGAGAAYALHYAVKCLRRELGDSPSAMLAWVPYVHMGV